MKATILALALFGLLVLGGRELRAQVYGPYFNPYWDAQYQQYLQYQNYLQWQQYLHYLRVYDPYYDLHAMHYQLYLQPYQPYLSYSPCCYSFGVPFGSTPVTPGPRLGIGSRPRSFTSPRSQAAVGPLAPAVGPLPPAVSPLPRATPGR